MKNNIQQILLENYNQVEHEITFKEWVIMESENDPTFFNFFFDDISIEDFGDLTDDQNRAWKNYCSELDYIDQEEKETIQPKFEDFEIIAEDFTGASNYVVVKKLMDNNDVQDAIDFADRHYNGSREFDTEFDFDTPIMEETTQEYGLEVGSVIVLKEIDSEDENEFDDIDTSEFEFDSECTDLKEFSEGDNLGWYAEIDGVYYYKVKDSQDEPQVIYFEGERVITL